MFLGRKRVGRKRGGAGRTPPRGAVREGPGGSRVGGGRGGGGGGSSRCASVGRISTKSLEC